MVTMITKNTAQIRTRRAVARIAAPSCAIELVAGQEGRHALGDERTLNLDPLQQEGVCTFYKLSARRHFDSTHSSSVGQPSLPRLDPVLS